MLTAEAMPFPFFLSLPWSHTTATLSMNASLIISHCSFGRWSQQSFGSFFFGVLGWGFVVGMTSSFSTHLCLHWDTPLSSTLHTFFRVFWCPQPFGNNTTPLSTNQCICNECWFPNLKSTRDHNWLFFNPVCSCPWSYKAQCMMSYHHKILVFFSTHFQFIACMFRMFWCPRPIGDNTKPPSTNQCICHECWFPNLMSTRNYNWPF